MLSLCAGFCSRSQVHGACLHRYFQRLAHRQVATPRRVRHPLPGDGRSCLRFGFGAQLQHVAGVPSFRNVFVVSWPKCSLLESAPSFISQTCLKQSMPHELRQILNDVK
jgi:hypothetical protein